MSSKSGKQSNTFEAKESSQESNGSKSRDNQASHHSDKKINKQSSAASLKHSSSSHTEVEFYMHNPIPHSEPNKLFRTKNAPLSFSIDGIAQKKNSKWQNVSLEILENGNVNCKNNSTNEIVKTFDISTVKLTKVLVSDSVRMDDRIGIKVYCRRKMYDTSFRILLLRSDLDNFCNAVSVASRSNNVSSFLTSEHEHDSHDDDLQSSDNDSGSQGNGNGNSSFSRSKKKSRPMSRIRTSVLGHIDKAEKLSIKQLIRARRGAFHWLPVYFSNDLVHGSWWWTFASLFTLVVAVIVLANNYDHRILGPDPSLLEQDAYRASWWMVIVMGIFCTIGSLGFMRAMNHPPMRPLFPHIYHLQTDELFGSWMIAIGMLPGIPYAFLFLIVEKSMAYVVIMGLSVVGVIGSFIFVYACYPSVQEHYLEHYGENAESKLLPWLRRLCFCCGQRTLEKHCVTDFLIGCWIAMYGTLFAVIAFAIYTVFYALKPVIPQYLPSGVSDETTDIGNFINITTLVDFVFFLIGCMYFVAGSYPLPKTLDDSSLSNSSKSSKSGAEFSV